MPSVSSVCDEARDFQFNRALENGFVKRRCHENLIAAVLVHLARSLGVTSGELLQPVAAPRGSRGHKQSGSRYAVVVQSDQLPLSIWLVAPTSTSARAARFRPEVDIGGANTRVLAEQAAAVHPDRLGKSVGFLNFDEMRRVDSALRIVLDL